MTRPHSAPKTTSAKMSLAKLQQQKRGDTDIQLAWKTGVKHLFEAGRWCQLLEVALVHANDSNKDKTFIVQPLDAHGGVDGDYLRIRFSDFIQVEEDAELDVEDDVELDGA